MAVRKSSSTAKAKTASYTHPDAKALIRPEAGAQTRFAKKKPAATYRYDSSLAPELSWDDQKVRDEGEGHLAAVQNALRTFQETLDTLQKQLGAAKPGKEAGDLAGLLSETRQKLSELGKGALQDGQEAVRRLQALSRPFLNWAGKAEHISFDVPTLPLFIHERLSTQAILDSVAEKRKDPQLSFASTFFGHPDRGLGEQLLKAYEHPNGWQNRMVLGDSLVAMNSLLHYENLGGQVQMIYIDPPYGVKFGSNFQPFVRKRDVSHNDDEGFTREPEMVKAYRDTWELGLHSYLTYLRDRLLLARELLTESGSVFVQISDENLHHVRELMDEVFGAENCISIINFAKTTSASGELLNSVNDFLIWYSKDKSKLKYRQIYLPRLGEGWVNYDYVRTSEGQFRRMTVEERQDWSKLQEGSIVYRRDNLTSQRPAGEGDVRSYEYDGKHYRPGKGTFKTDKKGLDKLAAANRLEAYGETLSYRRFVTDFPYMPISNQWTDTQTGGYAESRYYVVQTTMKVIQRCILMTTDPGDLILDPTCGSGTSAFVAETWGRRWITIDTSRVPLALARQRLLTGTFPYYELKEQNHGPAGGFVYKERKNKKGEHVGGIVPHITLGSIANNEPAQQEVLVDRPEEISGVTRVCGPFVFEATIPTASNFDGSSPDAAHPSEIASDFVDRMVEVLRASPVIQIGQGKTVQMTGIRRPAKTLYLSAEAFVREAGMTESVLEAAEGKGEKGEPVAILFGPEHGPVSEVAVLNAWQEATAKAAKHLYVFGFAIEPKARQSIGEYSAMGMPTTYVQATPDILMGDLLKNMRSSQIFSVCGQPDVAVRPLDPPKDALPGEEFFEVQLRGLDVFDPITMDIDTCKGLDVPAWFLDTDYNGLVFRVCQAFFPRTQSWDNLKRALKADFDESVWAHLAGDTSTPFSPGNHRQIAVKVIDERGNELLVVRPLEARR